MAKKLLTHCGSRGSFKTKTAQLAAIDGVGSMLLRNLKSQAIFDKANAELAFIRTKSMFQGENYPERLKHCIDGPLYYFSGQLI
jgi:DNA processing protein